MDTTKHDHTTGRRSFLKTISSCTGIFLFQPFAFGASEKRTILRFGLIADVHQDIIHDGSQRIKAFAEAMNEAKADFVCQLGDFCQPRTRNQGFLENWKRFNGCQCHVIGNHEMDGGFTREQVVEFFGMPAKHYSFDKNGVHIIVLDGNDPGGKQKGYNRYVSTEQLNWISGDLRSTLLPTIVFIHQALDDAPGAGIENSEEVRKVLEEAKIETGQQKVVACFCGHHHDDQAREINGIHYIRINSASYVWLGGKYKHESYNKEIHKEFPALSSTAPFKDPLWAFVEMDLAKGRLIVTGKKTSWVGPTPWERGVTRKEKDPNVYAPRISDRAIPFLVNRP